jgi:hypothetical protein
VVCGLGSCGDAWKGVSNAGSTTRFECNISNNCPCTSSSCSQSPSSCIVFECSFVNEMWDVGIMVWIRLVVLNVQVVETCPNMLFALLSSIDAGPDRCVVVVVDNDDVVCGVDHH